MSRPVQINLKAIIDGLRIKKMTVAFAESCTGGRLAADLTTIPGASDVVMGSLVVYQIAAKKRILGLANVTESNVVSFPTAKEMAYAAREMFGSTIAISTTGYLDGDSPQAVVAVAWPSDPLTGSKTDPRAEWVEDLRPSLPREVNRDLVIYAAMLELMPFAKEPT